jgi:hypothetical protein
MTLQRGAAGAAVTVKGASTQYRADQLLGGIIQGDRRVEILADEIAAAAWPAPPKKNDRLTIDGVVTTLQGAEALFEGATCIGYRLWVRG